MLPDFVAVCETFANENISDAYLKLVGYEMIVRKYGRDTTNGRTRGLIIYSREGLKASPLNIAGGNTFTECAGISIPWGRGEILKLVLVYIPPTAPGSEADGGNTVRMCEVLSKLEGNVVTVGDFNMKGIDWDLGWSASAGENMLLDLVGDKFWTQLVRGPTHVDGNTLDLVMPSSPELVAGVETLGFLGSCDHNMIEISLVGPALDQSSKQLVPDWSKADYEAIKVALEEVNWEEEFRDKPGSDCMDILYSVIERETERCIPKKLRRTSSKPIWMNKNIMRLIRKKRRAWRNYSTHEYYRGDYQSWQAYKKVQDDVKKAVRLAKRKLERSLAKNAKKNPKAFYSYLKKKVSNQVSVGPLKEGDELVTDEGRMAEMLNSFFCSVFTQEDLDELPQPEQLYHGEEPFSNVTFDQETV